MQQYLIEDDLIPDPPSVLEELGIVPPNLSFVQQSFKRWIEHGYAIIKDR